MEKFLNFVETGASPSVGDSLPALKMTTRKEVKNMFDAYKIKGTPAEITYSLAWLIYEERYSRSDAEYIITELLGNEFHYDGRDFSGYVEIYKSVNDDDEFEPDYDGALEILNNVETI